MSELTDLIDKNKRADAAELNRNLNRSVADFEREIQPACAGCTYVWHTVYGIQARRPIWIPEAGAYFHLRCWQKRKEGAKP